MRSRDQRPESPLFSYMLQDGELREVCKGYNNRQARCANAEPHSECQVPVEAKLSTGEVLRMPSRVHRCSRCGSPGHYQGPPDNRFCRKPANLCPPCSPWNINGHKYMHLIGPDTVI